VSSVPASLPTTEYFENLYHDAPFGYLVTDPDDAVVRVNGTLLSWAGYTPEQVLGRPFRSFLTPGSQLLYETKHLPLVRLQGFAHEVFLHLTKADGTVLPILINADAITDASPGSGQDGVSGGASDPFDARSVVGEPTEVRIGVLAAPSRVSYEQELLAAQRTAESLIAQVAVLQDASTAFAVTHTEVAVAETLTTILENALAASAVCVAFVEPSGELNVVAGTNLLEGLIYADRQILSKTVIQDEKPIIVSRTDADAKLYPNIVNALRTARLHTVAVFPIMSDATPIGITAAFFGRLREILPVDSEMVLAVARQASLVLTRLRAQNQLAYAALHDQLTGLANRAFIRESIALALASAASRSHPISVMFIDLDGFKAVNDHCGHHVGDAILREVAKRLGSSVRSADFVGRYGGDEFVVICNDTGSQDSGAIASRIHAEVRRPYSDAEGFPISASIGIAVQDAGAEPVSVDDFITAADAAMYESKRLGRDRTTLVQV
jgi:diguanylate cyclase (GGDEF)-like protein/PAS domain S-box-containing protein